MHLALFASKALASTQRERTGTANTTTTHSQTAEQVLLALAAQRARLGATRLAAHEQFCVADGARDAARTRAGVWPAIGRVNVHTYDSSEFVGAKAPRLVCRAQDNRYRRAALRRAAAKAGRDVWVSEFGTGKGAEALARHVLVRGAGLGGGTLPAWQLSLILAVPVPLLSPHLLLLPSHQQNT